MPDSAPRVRTLFRSDLVYVFDYRCAGHGEARDEIPQGYEIVLPRAGAYQRRDVHGSFLADPNQIVFYNQGEPYDISHPIQGGDSSTVFILAPALLREIIQTRDPAGADHPNHIFRRSHITYAARLQALQYQLFGAATNNVEALALEEQIILAADKILGALAQEASARPGQSLPGTLRQHAEQTHAVRLFLNTHVQSPLQLEQISSAVYLSPYHLCRVFKQNTGMTLHRYVSRLRLFNAAERMLENPAARLDLLAHDYGFSNHGHFTTSFRQTFGFNPSELRRAHLGQMSKILKA